MNRRTLFKSLLSTAAVIALAPQIAFGFKPKMPSIDNELTTVSLVTSHGDHLPDVIIESYFKDVRVLGYSIVGDHCGSTRYHVLLRKSDVAKMHDAMRYGGVRPSSVGFSLQYRKEYDQQ